MHRMSYPTWEDIMAMKRNWQFLIRKDASVQRPSPLLDIEDVRRIANERIVSLERQLEQR